MHRLWKADFDVSPRAVRELLRAQFPELAEQPMEFLDEGWDNAMYEVGGWVLRFPRRAIAVALIEKEIAVLPWLAPRMTLPIPDPQLVGEASEGYPTRFAGYRKLVGRSPDRVAPSDEDLERIAPVLGEFVGRLHATDLEEARAAHVEESSVRSDLGRRRTGVERAFEGLARTMLAGRLPAMRALFGDIMERAMEVAPCAPRLAHCDLHVRNLLVSEGSKELTAVLDWGDHAIDDPAMDLGLAQHWFEAGAREAFEAAYSAEFEPVTPEMRLRARAFGLCTLVHLLAYAADTTQPTLVSDCLAGLRRLDDAVHAREV